MAEQKTEQLDSARDMVKYIERRDRKKALIGSASMLIAALADIAIAVWRVQHEPQILQYPTMDWVLMNIGQLMFVLAGVRAAMAYIFGKDMA